MYSGGNYEIFLKKKRVKCMENSMTKENEIVIAIVDIEIKDNIIAI